MSFVTGKIEQVKKQSIQSRRVAALEAAGVHHDFKICMPPLNADFKRYV